MQRRCLLIQAKVRSTTQRRGKTLEAFDVVCAFDDLDRV
jgi:hypothetical protein